MILFSNRNLVTNQKSVFFCSDRSKQVKISILSSVKNNMSEKTFMVGNKVNKSYYLQCSINTKQIADEYLRIFINEDDKVNSYNGLFISKEMFKPVCGLEHGSITIQKVIKVAIFGENTILTMLYKNAVQMYFLLHPELGWVNITQYYDDDVQNNMTYDYHYNLIEKEL